MQANCNCDDYYYNDTECDEGNGARWCKHVAALGCVFVKKVERKPAAFLEYLGVGLVGMVRKDLVEGEHSLEAETRMKPAKRHCRVPLRGHGKSSLDPLVLE